MPKQKEYTLEELEAIRGSWNHDALEASIPGTIIKALNLLGDDKHERGHSWKQHAVLHVGQMYIFGLYHQQYWTSIYVNVYEVDDWNDGNIDRDLVMQWVERNDKESYVPEHARERVTKKEKDTFIIPGHWWGIVVDLAKEIEAAELEEAQAVEEEKRDKLAKRLMIDTINPKYLKIKEKKSE